MANGTGYGVTDISGSADSRVSFPSGTMPIGACVHTTYGTDSTSWLTGGSFHAGRTASADYLIKRSGERLKLCRSGRRPYHVGKSKYTLNNRLYQGDELSALLMGYELECARDERVTWQQLDSLAELIVLDGIARGWRWPYTLVGHYELAVPMGRRSDPHNFDWGDFIGRLVLHAYDRKVPGLVPELSGH
jgi:N-acetyl-anhydromuramyl-L-alanine amidase AmpD